MKKDWEFWDDVCGMIWAIGGPIVFVAAFLFLSYRVFIHL